MQEWLGEYYDIFAKHRFDVGYNTELKVKWTPLHDIPVYVQSPTTPIHLRHETLVELALMQYYGLVTLLLNSRYSSPIFAQTSHQWNWEFWLILDELITFSGMITVTIILRYQT